MAKEQAGMARAWSLVASGGWSEALAAQARTQELVEESRRRLRESDWVLDWCRRFGPLAPPSSQVEAAEDVCEAAVGIAGDKD